MRRAGWFRCETGQAVRAPAASSCFTCQISKQMHAATRGTVLKPT